MTSQLFVPNSKSSDEDSKYSYEDPETRLFIEGLWDRYKDFADTDFAKKIKDPFHNHFWEMYLACTLEDNGKNLQPKTQQKGPDIEIKGGEFPRIWVEAIAVSSGQGQDRVPLIPNEKNFYVPEERIVLRYTSAIAEKFKKYKGYLEDGVMVESEPYIIAVNGGKVPFSQDDIIPYIVQAVLPYGNPTLLFDWDDNKKLQAEYAYRPNIEKISGVNVATTTFLNDDHRGISGIIFSRINVHQVRSDMGSDFIFIHNPLAANKLPEGWLQVGREYRVQKDSLQYRRWPR